MLALGSLAAAEAVAGNASWLCAAAVPGGRKVKSDARNGSTALALYLWFVKPVDQLCSR